MKPLVHVFCRVRRMQGSVPKGTGTKLGFMLHGGGFGTQHGTQHHVMGVHMSRLQGADTKYEACGYGMLISWFQRSWR